MIGSFRQRPKQRLSPDPGGDSTPLDKESFIRELEEEIERAKRGSRRLSVIAGQLGSPGEYEFAGGQTADPLINRVATVLVQQKRGIDAIAALGQGRFALILPETGEPGALIVAERLRAEVASAFTEAAAPRLGFGVATLGRHGRSANALLRSALRALVAWKELDQDAA